MAISHLRNGLFIVLIASIAVLQPSLALSSDPADEGLFFERDIRPILRAHCLDCHGATDDLEGGLDLRQVRRMLTGGDSGAAISPGAPETSLLLERLHDQEMPPGPAKVPADEIETIASWIRQGAARRGPNRKRSPPASA